MKWLFGWLAWIFEIESSHGNVRRVVKVTCLESLEVEQRTHRGIAKKKLAMIATSIGRGGSQEQRSCGIVWKKNRLEGFGTLHRPNCQRALPISRRCGEPVHAALALNISSWGLDQPNLIQALRHDNMKQQFHDLTLTHSPMTLGATSRYETCCSAWWFPEIGPSPVIIHFRLEFSLTKTIHCRVPPWRAGPPKLCLTSFHRDAMNPGQGSPEDPLPASPAKCVSTNWGILGMDYWNYNKLGD